jgi:hypothetical protein
MKTKHFAIKAGPVFALIHVDPELGCCTAESLCADDGPIVVFGTDDDAIARVSRNCMGVSFKTLKALRESTSDKVERRRDLDF